MARTPSSMLLPVGTEAPDFSLLDALTGATVTRDALAGPAGLLVMFICNHCPYVIHVRGEIGRLAQDVLTRGVAVAAVSANDPQAYPQDGPVEMRRLAESEGWTFPYLFDATQEVAAAYGAACTPDFFLFDSELRLFYRGRLDASRPGNEEPVTGADLRGAVDGMLAGDPPPADQLPSMGCSIKWRPGNDPQERR